ncbi:FG-GAP repeat domain-containing protein [Streptomyces sp. NPDC056672]|uniref:FG-GAP repeat domain-containing protein n=1 Tax=Streptomyces sp. NPDC056672 TaxID=3345906 RepID=UPI003695E198
MSAHARPGAQWPRRITRSAVLGCAALLVSGSLMVTASAAEPGAGAHGPITLPVPASAARPVFTIPGRTDAGAAAGATGERRLAAARAAAAGAAGRADLNGDGTSDLLYRVSNGDVWADWGTGGAVVIASDSSQVKDLLLPGDLTGDGTADLLTLTPTGALRLHSGANATTDGGMTAYTTLSNGWQAYDKLVVPGDLTGDGTPDLLARSSAGLYVFPGTGKGFATGTKVGGGGWSQFDQLVGADDLTGDGIADLIARNPTGLYVYPGNGAATGYPFQERVQIGGTGWLQYNQLVGGADYDGDGTADLVARSYDGTLYYYAGTGTGTFAARELAGTEWGTVTQFAGSGPRPNFGKGGVFARTPGGTLYYYDATGTGRLSAKYLIGEGWDRSVSRLTHAVSLRANGLSDLIEHSLYDGHLYNSGLYASSDPDIAGGSKSYNLVIGPGDLDGDGKSDLLARSSTALYFYAGAGTGLSVKPRVQIGGSGWTQFDKIVGAGDLTGDGRADLVARGSAGLYLYAGTGTASTPFAAKAQVGGAGWSQYKNIAAPGDLDGDGAADLLASNTAGELYFYGGTGKADVPFKARVRIGSGGWNQYADLL